MATHGVQRSKVCVVVGQLTRGGLERQACLLASNLDPDRWDVMVISLSRGGAWRDELKRAGVRVEALERQGRWDVRRLYGLVRLFRSRRPQIVYSFNYETNAYARIAGLIARVPILVTGERGIYLEGFQILLERALHRVTECVVTNADAIRRDLLGRIGLSSAKVVTVRNAVVVPARPSQAEREAARRELRVASEDQVVVGTIARLDAVKSLEVLVRAAEVARNKGLRVTYRIIGGGPEEARLSREISERRLGGDVLLLGERDKASALLSGCDIFVLTSRSEGMPNTVLEAMAAGLPCVCTDVGGCRELVQDGVTGHLVPSGDATALAARVTDLVLDVEKRRRMGEAGRRRAEAEFSLSRLVADTEGLFFRLLAAKDFTARGRRLVESPATGGR